MIFHTPTISKKELKESDLYIGQKVQIVGWYTRYEDKKEEDRENFEIYDGDRCSYLNRKGYIDSSKENGIPDLIVLKDEALLIRNFKVKEII